MPEVAKLFLCILRFIEESNASIIKCGNLPFQLIESYFEVQNKGTQNHETDKKGNSERVSYFFYL